MSKKKGRVLKPGEKTNVPIGDQVVEVHFEIHSDETDSDVLIRLLDNLDNEVGTIRVRNGVAEADVYS